MIHLNPDIPRRLALDVELRDDIPMKNGYPDWAGAKRGKCGISTIATWDTTEVYPSIALVDGTRLPRTLLTEDWLAKKIEAADGLVTWNGAGFDLPVMSATSGLFRKVLDGARNVDLMAIAALINVGVDPALLEDGVPEDWAKLVPRIGAKAAAFINKGWNLDDTAVMTLGEAASKVKGFNGAKVIKAWHQGRYSEVASYNLGDAALTVMLYYHVWEHGWLASKEHGKVQIPREVL